MRLMEHFDHRPIGRISGSESRSFVVLAVLALVIWAASTVAMGGL